MRIRQNKYHRRRPWWGPSTALAYRAIEFALGATGHVTPIWHAVPRGVRPAELNSRHGAPRY